MAAVCAVASVVFLRLMPRPRGYRPTTAATARTVADGIRTSLRDPALLALYAQGALLMGGFVAVYNYLAFRLEGPEFGLPATVGSLIFAAYAAGTVSSRLTGRLVPRLGRRRVLLGGTLTMVAGALLTLSSALAVVVLGLLVLTAGFFAAHATASAWVGARATTGRAQATALYNVFYYSGSALVGWVLGYAWSGPGWAAVVGAVAALAVVAMGLALTGPAGPPATPAAGPGDATGRPPRLLPAQRPSDEAQHLGLGFAAAVLDLSLRPEKAATGRSRMVPLRRPLRTAAADAPGTSAGPRQPLRLAGHRTRGHRSEAAARRTFPCSRIRRRRSSVRATRSKAVSPCPRTGQGGDPRHTHAMRLHHPTDWRRGSVASDGTSSWAGHPGRRSSSGTRGWAQRSRSSRPTARGSGPRRCNPTRPLCVGSPGDSGRGEEYLGHVTTQCTAAGQHHRTPTPRPTRAGRTKQERQRAS